MIASLIQETSEIPRDLSQQKLFDEIKRLRNENEEKEDMLQIMESFYEKERKLFANQLISIVNKIEEQVMKEFENHDSSEKTYQNQFHDLVSEISVIETTLEQTAVFSKEKLDQRDVMLTNLKKEYEEQKNIALSLKSELDHAQSEANLQIENLKKIVDNLQKNFEILQAENKNLNVIIEKAIERKDFYKGKVKELQALTSKQSHKVLDQKKNVSEKKISELQEKFKKVNELYVQLLADKESFEKEKSSWIEKHATQMMTIRSLEIKLTNQADLFKREKSDLLDKQQASFIAIETSYAEKMEQLHKQEGEVIRVVKPILENVFKKTIPSLADLSYVLQVLEKAFLQYSKSDEPFILADSYQARKASNIQANESLTTFIQNLEKKLAESEKSLVLLSVFNEQLKNEISSNEKEKSKLLSGYDQFIEYDAWAKTLCRQISKRPVLPNAPLKEICKFISEAALSAGKQSVYQDKIDSLRNQKRLLLAFPDLLLFRSRKCDKYSIRPYIVSFIFCRQFTKQKVKITHQRTSSASSSAHKRIKNSNVE